MPNNENLSWLLTVDANTSGADKFSKSLEDAYIELGHVDAATSKAEKAMDSAGEHARKMGEDVVSSTKRYIAELTAAGVSTEHLSRLAKFLGESESGAAKEAHEAHEKGRESAKEHEEGFKGVGKAVDEAKEHVHGFLEAIGAVLAFEIAEKGIDLVRELGSEVLRTTAEAERMGKSFEFRFGVEGGKEALEYSEQFAKNTEFTVKQSKGFVSELGRAGVPLEEMDKYMAAAGDMAAMTGDKVQGMAGAIAGLGRARMTGAFDMRELRMIGIGVEQLKELPEFAKKSKEELRGLMKAGGSITEEQLFRVIASKGPEKNNVGDVATQMATTMGSQLDKLAELPERYIEKFRNSKGFDELKARFASTIEALDPEGPTGSRIFGALEGVFDVVAGKVAGIDFVKLADQITTGVIPTVKRMVDLATSIDWVGGVTAMVKMLEIGLRIAKGIGGAMGAVTGAIETVFGIRDKDIDRGAIKAAAEREVPSDVRRAVMKERGELPKTPETAAIADEEYNRTKALRLQKLAYTQGVKGHEVYEQPTALETYQRRIAEGLQHSEAAGPQLPKDRAFTMFPGGKAVDGAAAITPHFEMTGKDAAAGYVFGLTSYADGVSEAGADMAKAALKGTAKAQESRSPSRKFGRLGGDAVDGYTDALEDGASDAARAGAGLAKAGLDGADSVPSRARREAMGMGPFAAGSAAPTDDAPPPFAAAPAPSRDGRSVTVTIPITISVGGGATGKGADEAVDRLRSTLPGALTSALEQLGIEAGV